MLLQLFTLTHSYTFILLVVGSRITIHEPVPTTVEVVEAELSPPKEPVELWTNKRPLEVPLFPKRKMVLTPYPRPEAEPY